MPMPMAKATGPNEAMLDSMPPTAFSAIPPIVELSDGPGGGALGTAEGALGVDIEIYFLLLYHI